MDAAKQRIDLYTAPYSFCGIRQILPPTRVELAELMDRARTSDLYLFCGDYCG